MVEMVKKSWEKYEKAYKEECKPCQKEQIIEKGGKKVRLIPISREEAEKEWDKLVEFPDGSIGKKVVRMPLCGPETTGLQCWFKCDLPEASEPETYSEMNLKAFTLKHLKGKE